MGTGAVQDGVMVTEIETMVRVHTVNFGDLEIPQDKIVMFKEGLPGFPHIRRFTVLEREELHPFRYLQSLDDPPVALLIVNPFLIEPSYEFRLSPADMDEIGCAAPNQVSVHVVATIPDNAADTSVNLMAPIVINEEKNLGKQVIIHDSGYSVKHRLLKEAQAADQTAAKS